jgi:hypothetical protein
VDRSRIDGRIQTAEEAVSLAKSFWNRGHIARFIVVCLPLPYALVGRRNMALGSTWYFFSKLARSALRISEWLPNKSSKIKILPPSTTSTNSQSPTLGPTNLMGSLI